MNRAAATEWVEYDAKSMFAPREGEWCLWAVTIDEETSRFSGWIIEDSVYFDGWGAQKIADCDRLLWARVRTPEAVNVDSE